MSARDPAHASDPVGARYRGLLAGCTAFDAARFWDAHEAWEEIWHAWRSPDRDYLKGLIQFAAVQHHLQRRRPAPALALLARGRIQYQLLANRPLAWPLPSGTLLLVAAAQLARLRAGCEVAHTGLRLTPLLAASAGPPRPAPSPRP